MPSVFMPQATLCLLIAHCSRGCKVQTHPHGASFPPKRLNHLNVDNFFMDTKLSMRLLGLLAPQALTKGI